MYKIEFSDGTSLEDLELNGNNFISKTTIDKSFFTADKLKKVTFTDVAKESSKSYDDMKFIQSVPWESGSAFILLEMSDDEKRMNAIRNALKTNGDDITNIQLALAELFETLGGV